MKLAEFQKLCQQAWQECHGEIVTLWLTQESYEELSKDATASRMLDRGHLSVAREYVDFAPQNAAVSRIMNPVTKNPVRMKLAFDKDVADIYNGNTKQIFTKILQEG